jgi:hypothetical protein
MIDYKIEEVWLGDNPEYKPPDYHSGKYSIYVHHFLNINAAHHKMNELERRKGEQQGSAKLITADLWGGSSTNTLNFWLNKD